MRILIVEDEKEVAASIQDWLAAEGNHVNVAHDAENGLVLATKESFDIIILDLLLPNKSGVDFSRQYRATGGLARILILTAKVNIKDKENAFNAGADDFLSKPFDLREISIRVKALMRRSIAVCGSEIKILDLSLNLVSHRVLRGDKELLLSPQEFVLLEFFMSNEHRIFSADDLINKIWRGHSSNATVRTHIKTLRKKVDVPGLFPLIRTVHGIGYCISSTYFEK